LQYIKPHGTDAAFHFSVEDYFMNHAPLTEPLFMIWQADKCAMLGSNQVAQAEVDLTYAHETGITLVRRQSGGGTIFTDMGTLLYTLILPETEGKSPQEIVREIFAAPMVRALNKLGIPAEMAGRNDLLVDGRKFSGLAQYARKGRVCSHGSLLVDTDLDMLTRVLQVDPEKILSKAIQSVRSRVTNLSEHMDTPMSALDFWAMLEDKLKEEWDLQPYELSPSDLATIDTIYRQKFGNPDWTFGKAPPFSLHNSIRFPGGKLDLFLDVKNGIIRACTICGDFLGTQPTRELEEKLEGVTLQYEAVEAALKDLDLTPYLGGITKEEALTCMFGEGV